MKSMVLLKNEEKILPLSNEVKTLAVIGPNADSKEVLLGNYSGTLSKYTTLLQGIQQEAENRGIRVIYAEGCDLYKDSYRELCETDLIPEAVIAAQKSDAVILCLGLSPMLEGEEGEEGAVQCDRKELGLPGRQAQLLRAVADTGKKIILVLCNGSPVSITDEEPLVHAVVEAWYPGEEGGKALANIIFGKYSPAGRMPVTTVKYVEDLPPFEEYSMQSRTYRYLDKEPLYPFGFGLSYTTFKYKTEGFPEKIGMEQNLEFQVEVENTGNFSGETVLQIYIHDREASTEVPIRKLVFFKSVFVNRGEKKSISVNVESKNFAVVNENGEYILEPGEFQVFIGGIQPDERSRLLSGEEVIEKILLVEGSARKIPY